MEEISHLGQISSAVREIVVKFLSLSRVRVCRAWSLGVLGLGSGTGLWL